MTKQSKGAETERALSPALSPDRVNVEETAYQHALSTSLREKAR
jgi:hypothetical protein